MERHRQPRTGDLRTGVTGTKCIQLVTGRGPSAGSISVVIVWASGPTCCTFRFVAGDLLSK